MRILWLILASACSPDFSTKNGYTSSDNPLDSNNDQSFESLSGLPDLDDQMDPDYCESMQPDVAGATSYFKGIYILDNGEWFGREEWILHPTSAWTATNGETCKVTWEINAVEKEVMGCPSCDLSLDVDAYLNSQLTDCPDGLWEDDQQWSESYNILIDGDRSIFYFKNNGEPIGEGYANAKAVNFLSEVTCSWF